MIEQTYAPGITRRRLCNGNVAVSALETINRGSVWLGLVAALRPQTPKHIRGGRSHYTDTSEPVDGGVQL
jgi:hypothetical protein